MTRVVAKQGQDDLVVTSAQPGVLYISDDMWSALWVSRKSPFQRVEGAGVLLPGNGA